MFKDSRNLKYFQLLTVTKKNVLSLCSKFFSLHFNFTDAYGQYSIIISSNSGKSGRGGGQGPLSLIQILEFKKFGMSMLNKYNCDSKLRIILTIKIIY